MSLISVDLNVVYWSVLHLILDSAWVWYSLLLELKIPTLAWHWRLFIVSSMLRNLFSPSDENIQLKLLEKSLSWLEVSDGEKLLHFEFRLWDALALWGQWPYLFVLFVWKFCDEMFRYCEDNTYIIVIVIYRSDIWSWIMTFIASKNFNILRQLWSLLKDNATFAYFVRPKRLWSTLWISYYGGRQTLARQLYLADLHWQCRTEHSILYWSLKLWDAISMWEADLKKERCVLTMFCIQKKVVQIPCVNHFVLEKLADSFSLIVS